jgi:hypothetical protein
LDQKGRIIGFGSPLKFCGAANRAIRISDWETTGGPVVDQ